MNFKFAIFNSEISEAVIATYSAYNKTFSCKNCAKKKLIKHPSIQIEEISAPLLIIYMAGIGLCQFLTGFLIFFRFSNYKVFGQLLVKILNLGNKKYLIIIQT